jgi:hypothetical protein
VLKKGMRNSESCSGLLVEGIGDYASPLAAVTKNAARKAFLARATRETWLNNT